MLTVSPTLTCLVTMNRPCLPPPDESLRILYQDLIAEIDQRMQALIRQRFSGLLHCRPGCSECCIEFAVLPLEAALLLAVLGEEGRPAARSSQGNCCFLLENGICSVYERRPVLCRTQGLALAYIDTDQTIEVSACPINFPEEFSFEQEDLLFMDGFNDRLAVLNLQYCRQAGLQADCRIPLSDILASLG